MIKKETTFILGAGASQPYNYDTAFELAKNVVKGTSHHTQPLYQELIDLEFKKSEIIEFSNSLNNSGENSVDSFLEYRDNKIFRKIGKISMAYILSCQEEMSSNRFSGFTNTSDNWYHHIYNQLRTSFEYFDRNKLNIITFNYDRSFEQYLFTKLKTFGKTDEECAQKIENIPIVHLYGKLDNLSWENVNKNQREYGVVPHGERLVSTSENIQIIPEYDDVKSLKSFKMAFDLLETSEKIIFLGVNLLNQKNLDRLNIQNYINNSNTIERIMHKNDPSYYKMLATGLNLKNAERRAVEHYFNDEIFLGGFSENSTVFLREHVNLI